jgi:hypothetical protein
MRQPTGQSAQESRGVPGKARPPLPGPNEGNEARRARIVTTSLTFTIVDTLNSAIAGGFVTNVVKKT